MRIRLGGEETEGDAAVQMAPLIDCVFLLLIFFLVTAALREIHPELPLDLPDSGAATKDAKTADNTIVISINKAGAIFLQGEAANMQTLHTKLREHARKPNARVRLDGDRAAALQYVAYVLDLCQFEGLKNVGIRTKPSSD
jgi:biopolymer transport protein ExbD